MKASRSRNLALQPPIIALGGEWLEIAKEDNQNHTSDLCKLDLVHTILACVREISMGLQGLSYSECDQWLLLVGHAHKNTSLL